MSEGNMHDTYDFGNDPEFQKNFYNNIDKVLNDIDINYDVDIAKNEDNIDSDEMAIASEEDIVLYGDTDTSIDCELTNENYVPLKDTVEADVNKVEVTEADSLATDSTLSDGFSTDETAEYETEAYKSAADESAYTLENVPDMEAIDETLYDINASLAMQISDELESISSNNNKNRNMSRTKKIQIGVISGIVCLLVFAFFLGFTKPGNQLLFKMGINIGGAIWDVWTDDFTEAPVITADEDYLEEDDLASNAEEIDPDEIIWPDHPGYARQEEGVYNILLLGEEAIDSGTARGRTDLIIIATLNKNQKSIKLTSLLRDMLVQIPGYKDNKLNTAYEKGDVNLLYETIALNFNIRLDGCVMVNFENFEEIIDYMGGIELTLTSSEAKYLNNTNYISNPSYRDVVSGTQLMNGNQVLGYSRIRKRAAITGNNNDYGRTDRHRLILNAIFEKYKSKNVNDLAPMLFKILPMVKTDIESKTFEKLLSTFIEMRTMKIDQLRIPANGTFTDNVKVRGMDVLIPDLDKNVEILHEFVFGNIN